MIMMALPMIIVFLLCLSGIKASPVDNGGSSKTNDSLPGGQGNPQNHTASATITINPAIIQAINASNPGLDPLTWFMKVRDVMNNPQFSAEMNRILRQHENATKEEVEKAALDFLKDYLKQGADGLLWSSGLQDNAVVYACAGCTLSLPWNLTLSRGDSRIVDIQWFYSGRSEEMIASEAYGNFFAMPAFSGRVRKISNAGIEIDGVQVLERGNYSVEVFTRSAGGDVVTLRRSVYVFISG